MQLRILVSVKRVVDFNVRIRVRSDHLGVETANVKMSMNPFDEIAVEQAIQLKEQGIAKELIVMSIGPEGCAETLRMALAMGMDRAVHIKTASQLEPINVAKVMQHQVSVEKPDLIIMGKQAIDDDCNQTGQMLAALLNWPQATFISKLVIDTDNFRQAAVTREVDGGLEILEIILPAVVTTDLRLNKPRYISLPNIMRAKQKTIDTVLLESLSLDLLPHSKLKEVRPPDERKKGIMVSSVQELLVKLREEVRVI